MLSARVVLKQFIRDNGSWLLVDTSTIKKSLLVPKGSENQRPSLILTISNSMIDDKKGYLYR